MPHYCSAMVDLALLHSRKKTLKIKKAKQEENDETQNMVFICATMWHESRKEMEKILQSIKRFSHTHSPTQSTALGIFIKYNDT